MRRTFVGVVRSASEEGGTISLHLPSSSSSSSSSSMSLAPSFSEVTYIRNRHLPRWMKRNLKQGETVFVEFDSMSSSSSSSSSPSASSSSSSFSISSPTFSSSLSLQRISLREFGFVEDPPGRPSPNFFASFRIRNNQVIDNLNKFQSRLKRNYEKLLVHPGTYHISLAMLKIMDHENLYLAREIMKQTAAEMIDKFKDQPIGFKGVGSFGTRVVFVKVEQQKEPLMEMMKLMVQRFKDQGLFFEDKKRGEERTSQSNPETKVNVREKEIVPHLTIAKGGSIYESDWSDLRNEDFGSQYLTIEDIELCSHRLPKHEDKYYWTI